MRPLRDMFDEHLRRWNLTIDGPPMVTPTSGLLPVRRGDTAAMLKVAVNEEEERGNRLMIWWNGCGAARVLAHAGAAILMERAEAGVSLADLVRDGRDDEASGIMCALLRRLHAPRGEVAPVVVPLAAWFEPLGSAAEAQGGIMRAAAETASRLLATQRDIVPLHGDMHHRNVLRFGARGWRAIDPKGLVGERGFDHANIFCNPDERAATAPGRLARQVKVVADAAGLQPDRLLSWVLAWSGLSAAFCLEDGLSSDRALAVAAIAAAELGR
jgi:streptomycin 6-kinase